MKLPGKHLSSTVLFATAMLGINHSAYGQCQGDWCPIPNAYFDQNAPSHYGYDSSPRQYDQNPNWRGNPYWQGNQNPNWQGNQSPDWRNDTGWRGGNNNQGYTNQGYTSESSQPNSQNSSYSNQNIAQQNPNVRAAGQGSSYGNLNESQTAGTQLNSGSDTLLQQKIEDSLKNNYLKKNYKLVNARVFNGNVTLTGSVESEEDRQDAENRVRNIQGVRNINDQLKIEASSDVGSNDANQEAIADADQTSSDLADNSSAVSDEDLQKQAEDTLKNNYVKKNFDAVVVSVSNGVVTITGVVDTDKDRQDIRERLQKIKGLQKINDHLKVTGTKTSYNSSGSSYTR